MHFASHIEVGEFGGVAVQVSAGQRQNGIESVSGRYSCWCQAIHPVFHRESL
jgi:hypothetical protein